MNSKGDREHKESDKNMAKRLTTEEFIVRARETHGERYDYSEAVYVGMHDKLIIICKDHKHSFNQRPSAHLDGQGCPDCAIERHTKTTAQFIEESMALYGNEYNYSKSIYINSRTKIILIHNKCGKEFKQFPRAHLDGHICRDCAIESLYQYDIDMNFFKNNTPESFYVAGFLAADGHLSQKEDGYRIKLSLKEEDREHLSKILKLLKSNYPIYKEYFKNSKRNKKWNDTIGYAFTICRKEIYNDLARFNIKSNKSLIYDMPTWIINHSLVKFFILGYFDGDGGIQFQLPKNCKTRQFSINISGTKNFLFNIHNILYNQNIVKQSPNDKKIIFSNGIYRLQYCGNLNINNIMKYLYDNAPIVLNRKFILFQELQKQLQMPRYVGSINNYNAKFDLITVKQIREEFDKLIFNKIKFMKEKAEQYKVSFGCIANLVYRKTYKEEV